jgi:hypothetical protein
VMGAEGAARDSVERAGIRSEDCSGYVSKLPGAATAVNVELAWDMQRKRNGKAKSEQEVVTRGKWRMWKKGEFSRSRSAA